MSTEAIRLVRKEGKDVCQALRKEFYLNFSGQKSKTKIKEIFKSSRDLIEPEVFQSLREDTSEAAQDANGTRLMAAFVAGAILLSKSAQIVDNLLEAQASSEFTIDKTRVPFRESIKLFLTKSKERQAKKIQENRGSVLTKLNEFYLRQYAYLQKDSHDLGFSNYLDLREFTDSLKSLELAEKAKELIRDTEYISKELLSWFMHKKMDLKLKDAGAHNLFFLLNSFELKDSFPKLNTHKIAQSILDETGINLPATLMFDTEKRRGHITGSIPYIIEPGARMLISTNLTRTVSDYESFLESFGYCLCYGFTNMDDYFEYTHLRENSFLSTFSALIKGLVYEPAWLKKHLKIEADNDFMKFLYLRRLMETRILCAKVIYEVALYQRQDDKKEMYREIMEIATHCKAPSQDYLFDIQPHLDSLDEFKGSLVQTILRAYLINNYDEQWWRNKETSDLLIKIWETGGRTSTNMLSQEYELGEHEITYLLKTFEEILG